MLEYDTTATVSQRPKLVSFPTLSFYYSGKPCRWCFIWLKVWNIKIWEHVLYLFRKILCPSALDLPEAGTYPTIARQFLFLSCKRRQMVK